MSLHWEGWLEVLAAHTRIKPALVKGSLATPFTPTQYFLSMSFVFATWRMNIHDAFRFIKFAG